VIAEVVNVWRYSENKSRVIVDSLCGEKKKRMVKNWREEIGGEEIGGEEIGGEEIGREEVGGEEVGR